MKAWLQIAVVCLFYFFSFQILFSLFNAPAFQILICNFRRFQGTGNYYDIGCSTVYMLRRDRKCMHFLQNTDQAKLFFRLPMLSGC